MSTHKILLFIFCVVFSQLARAEEGSLFEGLSLGIHYGQLGIDPFDQSSLGLIEISTRLDDSRQTPQSVFLGITQQSGQSSDKKGDQTLYYVGYDYGYRLRLSRTFTPYLSAGLAYGYAQREDYHSIDPGGFATSEPASDTNAGVVWYVGGRYNLRLISRNWTASARYYGDGSLLNGILFGIALEFD